METKLQRKIIKWLKDDGWYVLKTRPMPGIPVGCPDVIALRGDRWLAIEVKADSKSPFRPGQEATLTYLSQGNRDVYVAHPDNWDTVKENIVAHQL